MKIKRWVLYLIILLIVIFAISIIAMTGNNNSEIKTIKSEKQLYRIANKEDDNVVLDVLIRVFTMPFSIDEWMYYIPSHGGGIVYDSVASSDLSTIIKDLSNGTSDVQETSGSKDYSTTNIQVENVDEADITKTDGDYIYSISDDKVIITDVKDPINIKIAAKIESEEENATPEDLILYNDKLVVISEKNNSNSSYYSGNANTVVEIYNIQDRKNPRKVKSYEIKEPYYTSRCINNRLIIISSGRLRNIDEDKIDVSYVEDNNTKNINLKNIKYLKDIKTVQQTIIATTDLDKVQDDINIQSYLMDVSNAYISENNIYLLDYHYDYNYRSDIVSMLKSIFGLKGIFGIADYEDETYSSVRCTNIYKFSISKDGTIKYEAKTKEEGQTINQYSLDEKNGHLRIALYNNEGTRIAIFDEKLSKIGETEKLAKGELMYSSRFINDKAYLVTYKTIDPLFVIDLSNESKPRVLGKLKIPGYSTYLHPYDENYLIGIGMETKETKTRNSSGKVISTSAQIVGMKMALFNVQDVNHPIQVSSVVIGDSKTTSAILTNPKALLFSKEKNLIAIPVNNYNEAVELTTTDTDNIESIEKVYRNYNKSYVSEGYFVYNIDTTNGFELKGVIKHEKNVKKSQYYYYRSSQSKLLRGMYIDNNLYTVSENKIMVNALNNLELISEMKIN